MGQDAPKPTSRKQTSVPPTPRERRRQRKQDEVRKPLQSAEQEQQRKPTLKEQWQAKRLEHAAIREMNAVERKRKKEALHAALLAQQKETEEPVDDVHASDVGSIDGDNPLLEHAEAEAMQTRAQINAQLAAFKNFMLDNPDVDKELDTVAADPASIFDPEASLMPARGANNRRGYTDGSGSGLEGAEDDEAIANVSVHSSDYANEELMQGLNDLDEEIEEEFQRNIEALREEVARHKEQSLAYLREHNDKPAALEELRKAKQIEAKIKALMDEHETPLRVLIENQQSTIAELEDLTATRKQNSIAALRAGNKSVALLLLKESKGFEAQLEAAKATLATLLEQRDKQLRSNGDH